MNSFDLDIQAIRVPADLGCNAGRGALDEVVALQEGIERNDDRLLRSLSSFSAFWGYLKRRFAGSAANSASAVVAGGWSKAA